AVEQADITRPRRRTAQQSRYIAPISDSSPRLRFRPLILIGETGYRIDRDLSRFIKLAAADLGESSSNHHVAIALNLAGENESLGINRRVEVGPGQACKLVVRRIQEAGIHSTVGQ